MSRKPKGSKGPRHRHNPEGGRRLDTVSGVERGTRTNSGRQVGGGEKKVWGEIRMDRRSFLGVLGVGLGAAVLGGLVGSGLRILEDDTRKKNEDTTSELLEGTIFVKKIKGIEIYVGNSLFKNDLLWKGLIESLEPMISILPDEMVTRIRFIRLDTFVDPTIIAPFEGTSRADVGGMRLVAYSNHLKNGISPKIKIRLAEVFFHEGTHLGSYGDPDYENPYKLRWLRQRELDQCKNSEEFIVSLTDLIGKQSLQEWLEISAQNGGYVSDGRIRPDQIRERDLLGYKNFGYILNNTDLRYGRLSLAEDIACVFEKILSSLYRVIHLNENSEAVISDLLRETPGETGLYRKYQIACESLIRWYEEGSRQHEILREFIRIIKDAIKAGGTTGGQRTSVESLRGRLAAIREAGRIPNSQGTQTIKDAIKAGGTTGVQKTPLGWLMGQRFTNTGKSAGQGPS